MKLNRENNEIEIDTDIFCTPERTQNQRETNKKMRLKNKHTPGEQRWQTIDAAGKRKAEL